MEYNASHNDIFYCKEFKLKLANYLKENKLTQEQFLKKMENHTGKSISQGGLSKYIQSKRTPRKEEMLMIYEASQGAVQPNDFYLD